MARAARANKQAEVLCRALGVAVGISDAFSRERPLLKAWLAEVEGGEQPAKPAGPAASPALAWFAGRPKKSPKTGD